MPRASAKRKASGVPPSGAESSKAAKRRKTRADVSDDASGDEDADVAPVRHASALHVLGTTRRDTLRDALLAWYATVQDAREMPWRRPWDETLSSAERAQRAYEVWVSEVMLQQTQVATVIPYYTRWMKRFPTVQTLAAADIEDVNALWKGLGYYTRAARLLAGAQAVVNDFDGIIPSDPAVLEKSIPGIGRYSAGAITSIAYGVCAPVLDGNVHRLMSRVLALHAPPQAKATLSLLWNSAAETVADSKSPGDVNQALIELGATVCKPRAPACSECPISASCAAFNLTSGVPPSSLDDIEDLACCVCSPLPAAGGVTRFPMAKTRKKAREETDIACVVYFREWVLLRRRPAKGLLGGLYEFPTAPAGSPNAEPCAVVQECVLPTVCKKAVCEADVRGNEVNIVSETAVGDVLHVFSHIRQTWKVVVVRLSFVGSPGDADAALPETKPGCKWVRQADVAGCNLGTGTLKLWHLAESVGGPTS